MLFSIGLTDQQHQQIKKVLKISKNPLQDAYFTGFSDAAGQITSSHVACGDTQWLRKRWFI
ncbi:MAG: hypothetical protein Q7J38_05820 [Gallionella sp.]|nr:hypothetical protein [Gallionella sp.]